MDFSYLTPHREQAVPIYLQLYRRFRDAITEGKLNPGERVPSVRSLASELNLARGTVETAYQMLNSEGYFISRGPAGTIVSPQLTRLRNVTTQPTSKNSGRQSQAELSGLKAFQPGLPALDAFPRKTWARLAGRQLRAMNATVMAYPDPIGYEPLRQAIAVYLGISRGIDCTHEQVFITTGYCNSLDLIFHTLLQVGDTGWFEEPGYLFARQYLEHTGMRLVPVPVDGEGLIVSAGLQNAADAHFAVVTPTHQSPLGVALSLPRRLALMEWASARQAWIIEDDYDSEFRYCGRPLPALKSLDQCGRVLYAGTFSKVLFPGLRLAYLVVPKKEIKKFRETANRLQCNSSILTQATVADFMVQGHFARHLRKMRALYAIRRRYLIDALVQVFGEKLQISPWANGLHVLVYLKTKHSDDILASLANEQGLAVQALSNWSMCKGSPSGLILGFTNLATPEQALENVLRLGKALGKF
ncbi:PLP-dependent aminotransferase family protein [Pectobacteriaceae bacterium CE90]|nr:PLP-dependent aminotransferase family protein [Pectobacteriaceae bacterium CE90]